MVLEESTILKDQKNNSEPKIDCLHKYSDEFYDEYINNFEPNKKSRLLYRIIKRTFDIAVSFFALIVLLIPFAVIAIAIACDSKGPVIFKNKRIGRYGKEFNCYKFRSMSVTAPSDVATSLGGLESYVTKVGRFLRKTSLDELPQLFNVLLGQMSIIGYRPLVPTEINCNQMRKTLGVLEMRPGISGYAQIRGRDDVYYKNKAVLDAYYVKNAGLMMDLRLIFTSVKVVIKRTGNNDETNNSVTK